jgi:hypothetical protein
MMASNTAPAVVLDGEGLGRKLVIERIVDDK